LCQSLVDRVLKLILRERQVSKARELAEQGIVLLKNEACPICAEPRGVLPLSPELSIAVIGPTAERPESLVSVFYYS